MNTEYITKVQELIPNIPILVNVISRRVRQLNSGHPPLVQTRHRNELGDIALRELIEGKITWELDDSSLDKDGNPSVPV